MSFTKGDHMRDLGRLGGKASALVMQQKREAQWRAHGVTREVGQRIYAAGYQSGYQQALRALTPYRGRMVRDGAAKAPVEVV